MASRLATASSILARGVFDGLSSFIQLEDRISRLGDENTKVLGDAFEMFVEAFLATQTKFMAEDVWLVGQVPAPIRAEMNLPNSTMGIDGIFRTRLGTLVPYQVKFRSRRPTLTYTEVSPFLGLTERATDRIIFTNSNEIAVDAANRDAMRSVRGGDFDNLTPEDFQAIEAWLKEKPFRPALPQPRDYQAEALAGICGTLENNARATAVMACGAGKTLLALWAAERLRPRSVLVLVPSLTLLQQTLDEWSRNTSWGPAFSYLCVCSDTTVAQGVQREADAIQDHAMDVEFPVDTDPAKVRAFLERETDQIKVVFCTYQSSNVVIEGSAELAPFDLGIFDEAHKTTGPRGGTFAKCLSQDNIDIRKRLFLTATPRLYDISHRDREGEFRVVSMDDEAVYGPRAYTVTFGAAAKRGIICDYKVVVSVVDEQEVSQFALDHGITLVEGDQIGAKWVANQIAMERAVAKTGAIRAITFHSRVASAAEFSSLTTRGVKQFLPDFDVFHVSGAQKSSERKQVIRDFRQASKAIITNARCLTEGIDIPAVDMVAFIDARQSRVDIAQATGRAMRKPRGSDKTTGYVVIPLFLGRREEQSLEDALDASDFSEVAGVLNAMREQDEDLVDIIRALKEAKGRGDVFDPSALADKIEVLGPAVDLSVLQAHIYAEIVDRIGGSWDEWYGRLVKFKAREGHCRVPAAHVEDEYRLGTWVLERRKTKDQMPPERVRRLEELGFVWDPRSEQWEEGFRYLSQFKAREGHCRVSREHAEDGYRLGQWVGNQRTTKDGMPPERVRRLEELGFIWDQLTEQWEEGFRYFAQFKAREGHCRVPAAHVEDEYRLGKWVSFQRTTKDQMPPERVRRLEEQGFIWDPRTEQWEEGFRYLAQFKAREGHCQVPQGYDEGSFRLGQWVSVQRIKKDQMSSERVRRLEELGFIWDQLTEQWEEGFRYLAQFKAREDHCRVPAGHAEDGYKLGGWVDRQRTTKDQMPPERVRRLEELGFVWDPRSEQWEEGFRYLSQFKAREGHCQVPQGYDEGSFRLGQWVSVQRTAKDQIPPERVRRLEELGFIWDQLTEQWEEGFRYLAQFKAREGHCRVPYEHIEDGYQLGRWVSKRRAAKDQMPPERVRRLEEQGFIWDPRTEQWEEGFRYLAQFKAREGHCRVSREHAEDGYRLGQWVSVQRTAKDRMPPDRVRRLEELGFVWKGG